MPVLLPVQQQQQHHGRQQQQHYVSTTTPCDHNITAGLLPSLPLQRITLMLNNLCVACGTRLGTVDGHDFHSFPSLERLCQLKEEELRGMGFGYR